MRISSGLARGFNLKSPKSDKTRPATDAGRLALFSSLANAVENAAVLDLFAGTGAYGLEALSHGAVSATFVEKDKVALQCLKANCSGITSYIKNADIKISACDCFKFKSIQKFDFIFLDPPYPLLLANAAEIFKLVKGLCSTNTTVVLEAPFEFTPPEGYFEIIKRLGKKSRGKPTELIMQPLLSESEPEKTSAPENA